MNSLLNLGFIVVSIKSIKGYTIRTKWLDRMPNCNESANHLIEWTLRTAHWTLVTRHSIIKQFYPKPQIIREKPLHQTMCGISERKMRWEKSTYTTHDEIRFFVKIELDFISSFIEMRMTSRTFGKQILISSLFHAYICSSVDFLFSVLKQMSNVCVIVWTIVISIWFENNKMKQSEKLNALLRINPCILSSQSQSKW